MNDYLVKALAFNGEVRAYSVRSNRIQLVKRNAVMIHGEQLQQHLGDNDCGYNDGCYAKR